LDLSHNQLKTLPPEIAQLPNLTRLSLAHNPLIDLPADMVWLQKLETIELSRDMAPIKSQLAWMGLNCRVVYH
jgi:Leucine-rich repeat (LRR) protein